MRRRFDIFCSFELANRVRLIGLAVLFAVLVGLCFAGAAYAEGENNSATPKTENEINTQQTPDSTFIYDTPISDLAEATQYYDHKQVQVEGEVIGDRVIAEENSDYCWITLTSLDLNTHTIAIYMKNENADLIDTYGVYGKTGTRLRVIGVFNLACDQHQGISCLHANDVSVVEPGKVSEQNVDFGMLILGILLIAGGLVLMLAYKFVRNKMR